MLFEPYSAPRCVKRYVHGYYSLQNLRRVGGCQLETKPVYRSRGACILPNSINDPNFAMIILTRLVLRNKSIRIYSAGFTNIIITPHTLGSLTFFLFFSVPTGNCTYDRRGNRLNVFVQPFLVFMLRIPISSISGNPLEIGNGETLPAGN